MELPFLENGFLRSTLIFVAGLAVTFLIANYLNQILKRYVSGMAETQPKFITILTTMRRFIRIFPEMLQDEPSYNGHKGAKSKCYQAQGLSIDG